MRPKTHRVALLVLYALAFFMKLGDGQNKNVIPLNCRVPSTCRSVHHSHNTTFNKAQLASLYGVDGTDVWDRLSPHYGHFISVECSCGDFPSSGRAYFYKKEYQAQINDTVEGISEAYFDSQAWTDGGSNSNPISTNRTVVINLVCGCVDAKDKIVATYTVQYGDTLLQIANKFGAEQQEIQDLNSHLILDPAKILSGWVLFIPALRQNLGAASEATNESGEIPPPNQTHSKKQSLWMIITGIACAITIVLLAFLLWFCFRSKIVDCYQKTKGKEEDTMNKASTVTSIITTKGKDFKQESVERVKSYISYERTSIFNLQEVERLIANSHGTKVLGEGSFGKVYYGILDNQEIAIKKMKASKSKEFLAEMKVLCKVHHINVVELIGYSVGDEYLYLVYEYVQNGALSEHLHDPAIHGHHPLSWNARAQIALDAARGLEYIHDHTKTQYVHRDIKTSNILLDGQFRAKVADFGFAKLVEHVGDVRGSTTKIVGTPGYLAPEYVQDCHVTSKSDVFAFGVVLAELITGRRALIRSHLEANKMRSLISLLQGVFQQSDPENSLEGIVDPSLEDNYPMEEVFKMALLAKSCLNEDPMNRPHMRHIVVKISRILMASIEWEASLGGNSQIFSGLVNGR